MNTAERLIVVAENEQTAAQNEQIIAENVQKVYEAGKRSWVPDYMDNAGATTDYLTAFAGPHWTDDLYNPSGDMLGLTRTTNMYAYSKITDTKVAISVNYSNNNSSTFQNAQELVKVKKFTASPSLGLTQTFINCTKLRDLEMGGTIGKSISLQWSPLTPESMISVITHLKNVKGTESEYNVAVQFKAEYWTDLEGHSKPSDYIENLDPSITTWGEYVDSLGWNI